MTKPIRFLIDALFKNAAEIGSRPALDLSPRSTRSDRADSVTWAELSVWVGSLANGLVEIMDSNQPAQSRVVHPVSNTPEDVLMTLACQAAGIVESPVDVAGGDAYLRSCHDIVGGYWLDDDTKRDIVDRARADSRLNSAKAGQMITRPTKTISTNEDALVLWTSGTSGDPKGVVLSHRSLLLNAQAKLYAVPQSHSDRRLTVLSIAHAYARTCDLGTWLLSGCSLAITRGFDGWAEYSGVIGPTLCNMVPSIADRTQDEDLAPASLRLLGCGGAAMTVDRFEQWRRRGVTVIQGYGLTETGPVISSQTPDDSIAGHAGCLVQGWEYRLDQGRLFVRGESLMTRYWDDPEATAKRIDEQGWLDTGDLVRICDSTCQLEILGRSDDRIVLSNGYIIDPQALEKKLVSIRGIRTAVVGECSDGRTVELWVETDESCDPTRELDEFCSSLPRWEQPSRVIRFAVLETQRQSLFNRKGAMRRAEMLRYLSEL